MDTPEPAPAVIELEDLARDYHGTPALDGVTLRVMRGEVFGYLGPNGAGKTTTLRMLTTLLRPSRGDARVAGHSVVTAPLEVKARVGYVPESGAVFEMLTPREYLTLAGDLSLVPPAELRARVEEQLTFFGLQARMDERMETFSKGMKQKVCIASALLHKPEVLFLDEPMNGLDAEAVLQMKQLIQRLSAQGTTIFYTSHLLDLVEKVCTRVGALKKGRLVAVGTVPELLQQTGAADLEGALMTLWGAPA